MFSNVLNVDGDELAVWPNFKGLGVCYISIRFHTLVLLLQSPYNYVSVGFACSFSLPGPRVWRLPDNLRNSAFSIDILKLNFRNFPV